MFDAEHIKAEEPVITNFTALPDKFEDFKNKFLKVNPDTFEIIGVKELPIFQRRILGLASYFKSAQEQLMPRLLDIKLETVRMSNMQYNEYVDVRTDEITKTKRSQKIRTCMKFLPTLIASSDCVAILFFLPLMKQPEDPQDRKRRN